MNPPPLPELVAQAQALAQVGQFAALQREVN
jgi:hypothetical protein